MLVLPDGVTTGGDDEDVDLFRCRGTDQRPIAGDDRNGPRMGVRCGGGEYVTDCKAVAYWVAVALPVKVSTPAA